MLFLFFYLSYEIIPKKLIPLANKALESTKYRKLITEEKTNMLQPGSYQKNGVKFRISKSLFGPPAKEIKGHAYENNYLAIVPNKKYNLSQNLTNAAFALNQKMYILQNIAGSDESVSIYNVNEINPLYVITEVIMYTTDDNNNKRNIESTISKTVNFNWNDKENMPVFRPIILPFQNLKFGMGTKVKASASAKLHSRGTNYLQLDMTFKIEGSFGAGVQTIAGKSIIKDAALYDNEFLIWGQSLKLFGFEFKSGLFAYIEASIVNISLDTAIDFTFMHGYNFEAYNRIIVCTGFPSPGYTSTGWQSKAEKIDTVNDARQNGTQESYATTLYFSPRLDIGIKLGLDLPGSTSSWLRAGIRGEINFQFGADPVTCDFPYLFGKVEPVVSLFIGYDGLKILGFDVTPSFETTWELYKKTIFAKECAFLDVKVSPEFDIDKDPYYIPIVQIEKFEPNDQYENLPLYLLNIPNDHYVSVWKQNQTTNFKPFFSFNNRFKFDSLHYINNRYYINGGTTTYLNNMTGKGFIQGLRSFNVTYSYRKILSAMAAELIFCNSSELLFSMQNQHRYALLQANLTGGFSILMDDDVEFLDDSTPNEGLKKSGIRSQYLYYGTRYRQYVFETKNDIGKIRIDIYIKHKLSEDEQFYMTIYHAGIAESILTFISKFMGEFVYYIFYYYIEGVLVDTIKLSSEWLDYPNQFIALSTANNKSLYLRQIERLTPDYPSPIVRIKNNELVGPRRYSLAPIIEKDFYSFYEPQEKPFSVYLTFYDYSYFVLKLNLDGFINRDEYFKPEKIKQLTKFAMLLKCPGCFPISKHCETIDDDYYLIKLTINETVFLTGDDQCILIPMKSKNARVNSEFRITHFITLNNEGSSQCTHNTVFLKQNLGYFHAKWFKYACLTPKSEGETWNASFHNKFIGEKFKYKLTQIAEIKNRNLVLVSFQQDDPSNHDILLTKGYYNYPVNASYYKKSNVVTLFKADRCKKMFIFDNKDDEIYLKKLGNGKFYYETNETDPNNEIEFFCECKKMTDIYCENLFHRVMDDSVYFLFESQTSEGITITKSLVDEYPHGGVKREVIKLTKAVFYYTKSWNGSLKYYILKNEPNTYKITVEITAPKEMPEYRRIQLYMDGDEFVRYPIGFDILQYTDDPLLFLSKLGLDQNTQPGWVYFGEDSELYVIIDIEPKFNNEWCAAAASLSPIPNSSLSSSYSIDCGKGMKMKKGNCVVNNKFGWKFWVIVSAGIVVVLILIVAVIVMIKRCC